jgi:hypothetical protein
MGSINPLLGRSVLIMEDEPLLSHRTYEALRSTGASLVAAGAIKSALVPRSREIRDGAV